MLIHRLDFLQGEHDLEDRWPAGIGILLHPAGEHAEGEILVLQPVGHRPSNTIEAELMGKFRELERVLKIMLGSSPAAAP